MPRDPSTLRWVHVLRHDNRDRNEIFYCGDCTRIARNNGNDQCADRRRPPERWRRADALGDLTGIAERYLIVLVVHRRAKLDRLSRNLAFIAALMESGVEFVAIDNPHANKLTVHILAAVA
jgi:hypothetical protein